nr:MAG TPA: hypothetical protein [Caudoviricetes sp.]
MPCFFWGWGMGLHVEKLITFAVGCRVMAGVGISGRDGAWGYPCPSNHQTTPSMGRGSLAIRYGEF